MNIINNKVGWVFMVLFAFLSCKEDRGNYNYNEINEITISGIDTSYTINEGEHFKVNPVISYSEDQNPDTSNYKYEWFKGVEVGFFGDAPRLIFSKLNIDTQIDSGLGRYEMYFKVTDKKTGVYFLKNFRLAVVNKGYEGWLIFSDINGESRVDMVNTYGGKDIKYLNILDSMKSDLKLIGRPITIGTSRSNYIGGSLYINYAVTTKGGYAFNYRTMKAQPLYDFSNTLPNNSFSDFSDSRFFFDPLLDCLYTNGNIYVKLNSASFGGFINRKEDGQRFTAAPFYATISGSSGVPIMVLFNEEEQQFYRYPGSGNRSFLLNVSGVNTKKHQLLYMTYSAYNGGEVFAVLRNPENAKIYLLRFSLNGSLIYYEEITGTEVSNATQFAISPVYGYLFYSVGNKVYEYDGALKSSKLMLNLTSEKISMIKFYRFLMGKGLSYPDIEKQLIVSSYKESNSATSGKLSLYEVPSLNKDLILKSSFEGFGKIVDVTYKER